MNPERICQDSDWILAASGQAARWQQLSISLVLKRVASQFTCRAYASLDGHWSHDLYNLNTREIFTSFFFSPSTRGLCRMKMLPVVILAKYYSSAWSAVSERPNLTVRLVSQMSQLERVTPF